MANLSSAPFDAAAEEKFRDGYVHGAQEVVDAVGPHLTHKQAALLRGWMAHKLYPWRYADGKFVKAPHAPDLSV